MNAEFGFAVCSRITWSTVAFVVTFRVLLARSSVLARVQLTRRSRINLAVLALEPRRTVALIAVSPRNARPMLHARIVRAKVRRSPRQHVMIRARPRCQRTRSKHHRFRIHRTRVEHQSGPVQQTPRVLLPQDQHRRFVLDLLVRDQRHIVRLVGDRRRLLVNDAVQRPQLEHELQRVPPVVQVPARNASLDRLRAWRRQHDRHRVWQHRHEQCVAGVPLGQDFATCVGRVVEGRKPHKELRFELIAVRSLARSLTHFRTEPILNLP